MSLNNFTQKISDYTVANLRAFPCTLGLYSIIGGLLLDNPTYIFFGIYIYICDIFGSLLKNISKGIYNSLGKTYIPIIGLGPRPTGAKYCAAFITENNLEGHSSSYGMPSGHSIVAGATFMFWFKYINEHTQDVKLKRRQIVLLGIICSLLIISRFYFGCHTVQQSVIGGIVGIGLGSVGYNFLYKKVLYYVEYYNLMNF